MTSSHLVRRRELLRTGAAACAVGVAGCTAGSDAPAFREGFEDGLGDWEPGAHVGPEAPLEEFEWTVEVTDERAAEGERSLRIFNDGDYDDGEASTRAEPRRTSGASPTVERRG